MFSDCGSGLQLPCTRFTKVVSSFNRQLSSHQFTGTSIAHLYGIYLNPPSLFPRKPSLSPRRRFEEIATIASLKMPCFRGIDVSILAQPDSRKLPEFPHPDASSTRILLPTGLPPNDQAEESPRSDTGSARLHGGNPRISVYIPSVPGILLPIGDVAGGLT